jgi:hypothetical protein
MSEQDEYKNFNEEWAQHKQAVDRLQILWNQVTNEFESGVSNSTIGANVRSAA